MAKAEENHYGIHYSDTSTIKKAHKYVLVISASPRRKGNTDLLCDEFARGAKEAGAQVEKIFLGDYDIRSFQEADERHVGDSADVATDDAGCRYYRTGKSCLLYEYQRTDEDAYRPHLLTFHGFEG